MIEASSANFRTKEFIKSKKIEEIDREILLKIETLVQDAMSKGEFYIYEPLHEFQEEILRKSGELAKLIAYLRKIGYGVRTRGFWKEYGIDRISW